MYKFLKIIYVSFMTFRSKIQGFGLFGGLVVELDAYNLSSNFLRTPLKFRGDQTIRSSGFGFGIAVEFDADIFVIKLPTYLLKH